mmetsp:Transcript_1139/g.4815  ORF Transcript_1139/g.4815 Transcript_1139/m.4815 type:complete len:377 (+) Transcript_1139:1140-2270(+)
MRRWWSAERARMSISMHMQAIDQQSWDSSAKEKILRILFSFPFFARRASKLPYRTTSPSERSRPYRSVHPSALCSRTSASMFGLFPIAYKSFSRRICLLLYLGNERLKKQVCADGRKASGFSEASPLGAWTLKGIGNACTDAGMRLRAQANFRNCTLCSASSSSRTSQNQQTWASDSDTPPSYSATAFSNGTLISRRPQSSSSASRGLKRQSTSVGTTRPRPSTKAERRLWPSVRRINSTCSTNARAVAGRSFGESFSSSPAAACRPGISTGTTEPSLRLVLMLNTSSSGSRPASAHEGPLPSRLATTFSIVSKRRVVSRSTAARCSRDRGKSVMMRQICWEISRFILSPCRFATPISLPRNCARSSRCGPTFSPG